MFGTSQGDWALLTTYEKRKKRLKPRMNGGWRVDAIYGELFRQKANVAN